MSMPVSSPEIRHLAEDSFNKVILSAEKAVVDFWAEWCGPCRRFAPVFEQLSVEYPDVQFCKCNTDENQGIAQEFFIFSIPTTLFVRNGRVVHQISGCMTEDQFREALNAVFRESP